MMEFSPYQEDPDSPDAHFILKRTRPADQLAGPDRFSSLVGTHFSGAWHIPKCSR
jgi:hypothetical protein